MQVRQVDRGRIEAEWPHFAERLWPAVRQDSSYNLGGLLSQLLNGSAVLFEVTDGASGLWVVSFQDDDGIAAWTVAVAGQIDGGPKQRAKAIREAIAALEQSLKALGVVAHRLCGRSEWSRILPDYQPFDGARNGLEKRL